jgi:ComF family protein
MQDKQNSVTLARLARRLWQTLPIELILPRYCAVCQRDIRSATNLCYRCKPHLPDLASLMQSRCVRCFGVLSTAGCDRVCQVCQHEPLALDSIRYLWEYEGLARDLIRAMKYRPSAKLTRQAATTLYNSLSSLYPTAEWDLIVPIPSSRSTFFFRLFHPCNELARAISEATSIPVGHPLIRNSSRAPQASLDHTRRLARLSTLFELSLPEIINQKRVLLIEDVITTGATISAAAYQLRKGGAKRVDCLALARTRVWGRFRSKLASKLPIALSKSR